MGELIEVLNRTWDRVQYMKPPEIGGVIQKDRDWVNNVLIESSGDHIPRFRLDDKYWTCSREEFSKVVEWDWTDNKRYISERYDCDNFAFSFKARVDRRFHLNNVGIVIDWSGGHAYNLVFFDDGTWSIFEPQNDNWPTMGQGMYKFEHKVLII